MDDNFKSKKRSTGEKIMDRLKSDTKLSDEVKQKIQARMQHAKDANDSDSEAGSDDNDESDSDMADEKGRSERGNDSFVSTRSKISRSDSVYSSKFKTKLNDMKSKRKRKIGPNSNNDDDMKEDDEAEKEKQRKLEILRVKESKLKRNISKELKRKGKYNETDKRIPDGKPKFLNSGKRSGFKHDWR